MKTVLNTEHRAQWAKCSFEHVVADYVRAFNAEAKARRPEARFRTLPDGGHVCNGRFLDHADPGKILSRALLQFADPEALAKFFEAITAKDPNLPLHFHVVAAHNGLKRETAAEHAQQEHQTRKRAGSFAIKATKKKQTFPDPQDAAVLLHVRRWGCDYEIALDLCDIQPLRVDAWQYDRMNVKLSSENYATYFEPSFALRDCRTAPPKK